MTLFDHQDKFAKDVFRLFEYIFSFDGLKVSIGEVYRTLDQQKIYVEKGYSQTLNSMHLKKCAIDLNFVLFGDLVRSRDHEIIKLIGRFWCSLDPLNRWGGKYKTFDDFGHFERHV